MTVNNEVGTVFDATALRLAGETVHSDATQAVGKVGFQVGDLDFATFSAHKFYGPKGVGIVYARDPVALQPMILGGEHEGGLRSGTLNVPGIVGAGVAAEIAWAEMEHDPAHATGLRNLILNELIDCPDVLVNGGSKVSPHILSLSFAEVQGETLLLELDALGFGVSSGAACSSRKLEPSHVLRAAGIPDDWSRGTIRISFGRQNTLEAAERLARATKQTVANLRKMRK
jgi:cysteine desulfurase